MSAAFTSKVDLAPNVACLARTYGNINIRLRSLDTGKWQATLSSDGGLNLRSADYNTPEFAMADLANELQVTLARKYEELNK